MIDTHTADGLKVAREHQVWRDHVGAGNRLARQVYRHHHRQATGRQPERPHWIAGLDGLEALPKALTVMPSSRKP